MAIMRIIPQLRTKDMDSSIQFYTDKLGFSVKFKYEDFYVGIRAGEQFFHIKLVEEEDPSIRYVDEGEHIHLYFETEGVTAYADELKSKGVELVKDVHETDWNTREFINPRRSRTHALLWRAVMTTAVPPKSPALQNLQTLL